jgi:hypothetical protein
MTRWTIIDPTGYPYRNLVADTHDQAVINVLERVLPSNYYGKIRWGRSTRGTGALYYLWEAMQIQGWKASSDVSDDS